MIDFVTGIKPQDEENKKQHKFTTVIANEPESEWVKYREDWIKCALSVPTKETDQTEKLVAEIGAQNRGNRAAARDITMAKMRQMQSKRVDENGIDEI